MRRQNFFPAIAIGANDIAGTGFYNSEYIVFSKNIRNIDFSAGVGWGSLSGGINFKNPLIAFDKKFSSRSESFKDFGGSLDFNNYFSGKKQHYFWVLLLNYQKAIIFMLNTIQLLFPERWVIEIQI